MKNWHWIIAALAGLVGSAYCGLFLTGTPTGFCPFPLLTLFPAFLLAGINAVWFAAFIPPALFIAWNHSLFAGQHNIPRRSLVLLGILTSLTVYYFVESWSFGLRYQGVEFTHGICAANLAWLMLLWMVFVRGWRKPSFFSNLLAHWLLFVWLGWYAFPYLGELP